MNKKKEQLTMKKFKKVIALVLVLIMCFGVMPMTDLGIKADAAYENTASSYNYPIRKIVDTGRGFSSSGHKAVDFTAAKGTAVYASKSGTVAVVYSGCKNYSGAGSGTDCKEKGCTSSVKTYMSSYGGYFCNYGYGNGVIVKNDDGKYCSYAHLNSVNVKKGDAVTPSTKLGEVGSSGCSTGAHLHFSIHEKADSTAGAVYDPFKYIFPGFKIDITNNGSGSVNPKFRIYFPWKDFEASECKISFGTSSSSLTKTSADYNFETDMCYYDLGSKFGNLTNGKTYYIKVSVTKNGTTFTSNTYSFVAGAGNKTFLDYSAVASSTVTVTFNANGGSCSTASKTVTRGSTYGTLPTPTRGDYNFNGWYTSASGGTKVTSSTTVSATGNHTLYAQWTCNHSTTEIRDAKNATCSVEGYTGDTYCKICNAKTVTGTAVNKLPHTEVIDNAASASCTVTGLTEGKHCSVCNTIVVAQQTIPANGHVEVIDKAVSATCTNTGLTEGTHCSVCNTVIVAQQSVAAFDHKDNNFDGKCDYCGKSSTITDNPDDPIKDCSCSCHKGGTAGVFFMILNFFQKLFGINAVCTCGVKH